MFSILDAFKMGAGIAAGLMLYHLYAVSIGYPSAVREARAGYVILAERTSAAAKAAEMERQRNAASQATEEHRKRLAATERAEQSARDTLETEIQSYELQREKNHACAVTAADRQWLLHH